MDIAGGELPKSVHAETTVLGACLVEPDALNDALEFIEAGDFILDSHRKIWSAMADLAEDGKPVDIVTVVEQLQAKKHLDGVGGVSYLASLSEGLPRNLSILAYVKTIKDKAALRSIIALAEASAARAADNSEESSAILTDIEERVMELSSAMASQKFTTLLDSVRDAGGVEAFVSKMCDPAEMTGLATGFDDVDAMLGGLQRSELVILAARPGQGKTAWSINIAVNVVMDDPKAVVAVFSLEMSKSSLYRRMLASEAGVSARRAMQGYISAEERRKIGSALIFLSEKKIMIDDSASINSTQMRAKARRLKQREGRLDLIVIDYLQLMSAAKKYANREQEVASISRSLKAMAKELDVPVMAIAAISRASEKHSDKRPMLSDLRESGQIEFDADVVIFLHREEYYRPDDEEVKGLAEAIIAKARNGPTGIRRMAYNSDITRFDNLQRGQPDATNY